MSSGSSVITDPGDPRLSLYLHLRDRDLRRETGLFLAEGEHVVRRAFEAGLEVQSVLAVDTKAERIRDMAEQAGRPTTPVLACAKPVLEAAVGFKLHQGIIAAVRPPASSTLASVLSPVTEVQGESGPGGSASGVVLACPEITNVDNLGLLIRVAAGLGVRAMLLGPKCADPWYRRAVRVSMGAVFTMPLVHSDDFAADLEVLASVHGYERIATVIDADAPPLGATPPPAHGRVAVLLGSEGYGLDSSVVSQCEQRVRIPMHHEVDSLNVAVAAGIVVHHYVASIVATAR